MYETSKSRWMAGIWTLALILAASGSADAATITLDATARGNYNSGGNADAGPDSNYFVGSTGTESRNFFLFDLSSVTETVIAATLHLWNPSNGFFSTEPSETYAVFHVSSAAEDLATGNGGIPVFDDLGGGTQYAQRFVSVANNGQFVDLLLNSPALADINNALGGDFAIGGALTSLNPSTSNFLFGFTAGASKDAQLILETSPAVVDEPQTLVLLGMTLGGLAFVRRRMNPLPVPTR